VPGFVAATSTINSGVWSFTPSVTINSNTQYFFYTDSINNILRANTTGVFSGGIAYYAIASNSSFVTDPTSDTLFNLSGVTAVPEPGTLLLFSLSLLLVLALRQKPAKHARHDAE
jgi:hypothetical protein